MKQTVNCKKYKLIAAACLMLAGPVGAQTLLSDTGTATVPAGVYWVDVVISGAGGTGGNYDAEQGGPGGKGAQITATVAVQPGDVLTATKGLGGVPTPASQWPGIKATGGAGSGKGGDGADAVASGGGGGGGGATVVQIGGTVLRAGGGGGGGGDSWWGNIDGPVPGIGIAVGGDASTALVDTPDCATAADGANAIATTVNGGGGGGGGGGYQGAAGAAGVGGEDGTANGGGGQGGGSCYSAGPNNAFNGTPAASAGSAGGVGGDATTGRGTAGGDGTVLVTVNSTLPPPKPPVPAQPQSVPTLDLLGLGLLASLLGFLGLRNKRHG